MMWVHVCVCLFLCMIDNRVAKDVEDSNLMLKHTLIVAWTCQNPKLHFHCYYMMA